MHTSLRNGACQRLLGQQSYELCTCLTVHLFFFFYVIDIFGKGDCPSFLMIRQYNNLIKKEQLLFLLSSDSSDLTCNDHTNGGKIHLLDIVSGVQ